MERFSFFNKLTGFSPFLFQKKVRNYILNRNSIILRAPTGAGKSEAVVVPFLESIERRRCFPSQLIYSLPIRVLVEDIGKRCKKYANQLNVSMAVHHGEKPESELFKEKIVISTIDQVVSSYCCTPLSLPKSTGNICAGSISSSFLVFDEVHTFNLEFAFQAMRVLLDHSYKLKIPFAIISATLPDIFLKEMEKKYLCKIVDIENENEIFSRKNREIYLNPKFHF